MEQFVYSDIFDTKGIEYIIVIFFFMLIIPFWIMLNRPVKLKETMGDAIRAINLTAEAALVAPVLVQSVDVIEASYRRQQELEVDATDCR